MQRRRLMKASVKPPNREVVWVGSSLDDLKGMPVKVRRLMGTAIHWAQSRGVGPDGNQQPRLHPSAQKMKGVLSEVVEIRDEVDGNAYRGTYTAKLGERIYVLHAFQKKSKRGVATPARDLEQIRRRLQEARKHEKRYAERSNKS